MEIRAYKAEDGTLFADDKLRLARDRLIALREALYPRSAWGFGRITTYEQETALMNVANAWDKVKEAVDSVQ